MAGIFSKPKLDDIFFRQEEGTTLTLSGETKIATTSGLTLTDGAGSYIPIILTGGTTGKALTFIDNQMVLRASGAGATPVFDSCRSTTRIGVPEINVGGSTVQQFLEGYFFPDVPPTSSLSVSSGLILREFGDATFGNLAWGVVKNTNSISAIGLSTDGTGVYNCSITPTGNAQSGTQAYSFPSACASPIAPASSGVTSTVVTFALSAITTSAETTTTTATINWRNQRFYFGSTVKYTTSAINSLFSGGELSTTKAITLTITLNNEFFYYAYPKTFGLPSFTVNGLPNNAWGSVDAGTLFTDTFVNTNAYSNQYYVARSDNRITGTYNIIVS